VAGRVLRGLGLSLALTFAPEVVLLACTNNVPELSGTDTHFPMMYGDRPTLEQLAALGRKMFFDATLSASGKLACSSCHDPSHAYGPPDARVVQAGGVAMDRFGFRNAPSLRYLHSPVAFTEHFYEAEPTGSKDDQGPTGGRTWDGRVNTGHDQALMPLLDPNEMANASKEELFARLRKAGYAEEFQAAVSAPGEDVFADPESSLVWMTIAIEAFEQTAADFHPFTSKFDAYLRDEVDLTPAEQRGMSLFNDMKKGNCASCHPSMHKSPENHFPLFTDFGYVALAVPRNRDLPANRDPGFFDLGLCGPLRTDLKDHAEYCGLFRTPSLRNVALRKSFFHNGAMHSLRDVVSFYATRDIQRRRWYRDAQGRKSDVFDDLPASYHANVNTDPPFKPRADGRPRLSEREIDDIVAFLGTLSDGYRSPTGAARKPAGRRVASIRTTGPLGQQPH
jgi:cytochrome c peroxidase